MTVQNPPFVIQTGSHGAQLFRQAISTLIHSAGGVVGSGDYTITAQGTPNMTVNAAGGIPGGQAWVAGTTSSGIQGCYYVYNSATVVQTIAAADPSNPRIDISVLQIIDAFYVGGSTNTAQLAIVTGTPAGSPVQPTTPVSSLLLAAIAVAALTTTITTGNITDARVFMRPRERPLAVGGSPLIGTYLGQPVTMQFGVAAGTTDTFGTLAVTFPTPFPNGVFAVIPTPVQTGGQTFTMAAATLAMTTSTFNAHVYYLQGSSPYDVALVSVGVSQPYMAYGF